jgi:hypothetical protein
VDQLIGNVTVKVFSVDDMIKACANDVINNSRTLDFLAIFGHGTAGYQSIGVGQQYEHSGTKSLHYLGVARPGQSHLAGPAEKKITALNGLLSQSATIFLAGCNVGEGNYGSGLLTTISTILNNRTVQAFENKVFWWSGLLVGSLKEATGTDVDSSFAMYSL